MPGPWASECPRCECPARTGSLGRESGLVMAEGTSFLPCLLGFAVSRVMPVSQGGEQAPGGEWRGSGSLVI